MSTYSPESELSRLNRHAAGEPFQLSAALGEVMGLALKLCEETGGAFDPTVGPIVNAYGFGPDQPDTPPTDVELQALDAYVGCEHLAFDRAANTVTKSHPEVYCDLSAIAKGYAVDRAADGLDGLKVQDYMIEVGGEVVARGNNDRGQPWRIAVERPVAESHVAQEIVSLGAGQSESGAHGARWALATSGDYRNYFMEGDKRVSHTIDPRTHRPIDHALASASVIHSSCAWADGYATALMVLGDQAEAFADGAADLSAFFIWREGETFDIRQSKQWPGLPHN
jgi:thiamine biosynthesis lipoprotein